MLLDLLQPIPGPVFLVIFIILIILCFGIGKIIIGFDNTLKYPLPELTYFDPISIAYLRGGRNAVIRTAIFSLWSRNLIEIKTTPPPEKGYLIQSVPSRKMLLYPIEHEVYKYTATPKKYTEIVNDPRLIIPLIDPLNEINVELERFHLKPSLSNFRKSVIITTPLILFLLIIGGAKLYLGITRDKPVTCLVWLLIVALIGLPIGLLIPKRITKLGSLYLRSLEKNFKWMKESIKQWKIPSGIDPSYCVAIYGIESLRGESFLNTFRDALTIPKPVSSGGSCFSCSSCASCGGCGGCGGGGCGGCG